MVHDCTCTVFWRESAPDCGGTATRASSSTTACGEREVREKRPRSFGFRTTLQSSFNPLRVFRVSVHLSQAIRLLVIFEITVGFCCNAAVVMRNMSSSKTTSILICRAKRRHAFWSEWMDHVQVVFHQLLVSEMFATCFAMERQAWEHIWSSEPDPDIVEKPHLNLGSDS